MKTHRSTIRLSILMSLLIINVSLFAQDIKSKLAVISIDTKDVEVDKESMKSMILLELEKTNKFQVLDKYDVSDLLKKNGIDPAACMGTSCQIRVGKMLNTDKMVTGSVEKFNEKIIFILRLLDIKSENIEKTTVMEFINQQEELQTMVKIIINNLLNIENDKNLLDLLVNYDVPITSSKTIVKLNGPRIGFNYTWGNYATRMKAPESQGGFNMYPVSCLMGYQFEKQFLSSGDFQALFEFIPSISGMESGVFIPSFTTILGFRFNKHGYEFGLGPTFRGLRLADGYHDSLGNWQLQSNLQEGTTYPIEKTLDSRGYFKMTTGMIFAVGKTFKSGYLNMPVNVYYSPRKEGSVVGVTWGFNIAKKTKNRK